MRRDGAGTRRLATTEPLLGRRRRGPRTTGGSFAVARLALARCLLRRRLAGGGLAGRGLRGLLGRRLAGGGLAAVVFAAFLAAVLRVAVFGGRLLGQSSSWCAWRRPSSRSLVLAVLPSWRRSCGRRSSSPSAFLVVRFAAVFLAVVFFAVDFFAACLLRRDFFAAFLAVLAVVVFLVSRCAVGHLRGVLFLCGRHTCLLALVRRPHGRRLHTKKIALRRTSLPAFRRISFAPPSCAHRRDISVHDMSGATICGDRGNPLQSKGCTVRR